MPDVASDGDPNTGVIIYLNGVEEIIGGTSVSAPVWAGFVGWINQARLAAGKLTVGLLGPRIYPLLGTKNFRDTKAAATAATAPPPATIWSPA